MRLAGRISLSLAVASLLLTGSARAETVVKIGAALSLTGPAAAYGAQQKAGILAAVEELNKSGALKGVKLEAVIEDDASTKEQGIAVFQRFINKDKVSAIIGPTLSNTATAADPLAQGAKVPVVAVSNTAPKGITDIGDYIWRVSLTEGQVIPGALRRLQAKLGFKKAGMVYGNDDAFTQAGYNVMKAAVEALKLEVVGTQTFAKPDKDYTAQLTSLLAGQAGDPDRLGAGGERLRHRGPGPPARLAGAHLRRQRLQQPEADRQRRAGRRGGLRRHRLEQGEHRGAQPGLPQDHGRPRPRARPVLRAVLDRRDGDRRGHQALRRQGWARRRRAPASSR